MKTLFLMCGLPGAGKTTLARQMERARGAVRLSADEWIASLVADASDKAEVHRMRPHVHALQWGVAAGFLALGVDVILDWGFWSREERARYRARGEALGARVELCFLHAGRDELWARLSARNANPAPGTFVVTAEELDLWCGWIEPPSVEEIGQEGAGVGPR